MSSVEKFQLALDAIAMNTAKSVESIYNNASYTHLIEDIKSSFIEAYALVDELPEDRHVDPLNIDLDGLYSKAKQHVETLEMKIKK